MIFLRPNGQNLRNAVMSPSLELRENRHLARELKFLVPLDLGGAVRSWARAQLHPDPHGLNGDGDEYLISSIYFDTPQFDVFHRKGSHGRAKFRLRQYNGDPTIFLERKLKSKTFVTKRRCAVSHDELSQLLAPAQPGWIGQWFRKRLQLRQLTAQCQVSYQRTARVALTPDGPIRLTIDTNLQACRNTQPAFVGRDPLPLLPTQNIIEMKFRGEVPLPFKQLIEQFNLAPATISKYRTAAAALALAPGTTLPADAPPASVAAYA